MWTELFLLYSNIQVALNVVLDYSWTAGLFLREKAEKGCVAICENPRFQYFVGNALWSYCRTVLYIEDCAKHTYENSMVIRTVVDYVQWTIEHVELLFSKSRKEPVVDYWMCLCSLSRPPLCTSLDMFEAYEILNRPMTMEIQNSFAYTFSYSDQSMLRKNDAVFVMKMKDVYKVTRYSDVIPIAEVDDIVSECRFLSVTYSHPKMREPVDLKVPVGMMMVGNELFSPCFVKRCLDYQNRSSVFDMDYKLEVIDQNVRCYTLTSSDYFKIGLSSLELKQV